MTRKRFFLMFHLKAILACSSMAIASSPPSLPTAEQAAKYLESLRPKDKGDSMGSPKEKISVVCWAAFVSCPFATWHCGDEFRLFEKKADFDTTNACMSACAEAHSFCGTAQNCLPSSSEYEKLYAYAVSYSWKNIHTCDKGFPRRLHPPILPLHPPAKEDLQEKRNVK
jgi:hypothetical protein